MRKLGLSLQNYHEDLNLIEELRVTEASISLFTHTGCKEQRAATSGKRDIRVLLSFCEKILTVKETLLGSVSFTISSVT